MCGVGRSRWWEVYGAKGIGRHRVRLRLGVAILRKSLDLRHVALIH
jgi:hypothetical protein